MQKKTIEEINEIYDLELARIIKTIKNSRAKRVLLQFPEGMKPYSTVVVEYLEGLKELKNVQFFIWMGSCFGACDVPTDISELGVDLIIQFGHSAWKFEKNKEIKVV